MKTQGEDSTVTGVCQLLRRSKLLTVDEMEAVERRWRREAKDRADLPEFSRWLVAGRYVTEYQMNTLLRGHFEYFFLDEYKLLDKIGREQKARVYKAVSRVGLVVSVKVLPPSQARDAVGLAGFQREAGLARGIDHPNVVRVFGAGEDRGLHYIVMEYLEGETLQSVLARRSRLPVAEAVEIVVQALAGLEHLRERGLLHRNIEPANLLLILPPASRHRREQSGPPLVKLLDLSLCRTAVEESPAGEGGQRLRRADEEALLAAVYLAPELILDLHAGDIRSDIYSLGCVLYQALAGAPPFASGAGRQTSRAARGAVAPLNEVNPEVSAKLAQLVGKMMAVHPPERFSTPREAADALEAFQTRPSAVTVEMEPVAWPTPPLAPMVPLAPMAPLAPPEDFRSTEGFPAMSSPFELESSDGPLFVNPALAFTDAAPGLDSAAPVLSAPTARRARRQSLGDPRDWMLLLFGAGGLLILQGLAWVLAQLFRAG